MKLFRPIGILYVMFHLTLAASGQTDSVRPAPAVPAALAAPAAPDTSHHKSCCLHPFIRLSAGIGFTSSTYSSTMVTPSGNLSNDYIGNGYEVPLELVLGLRFHSLKIGLGISQILFHVPSLIRTPDPSDTSTATGATIKHQIKKFGTNYIFPLFLEYDLFANNHFVLAANMNLGIFYHDRSAYDGTYAPSARAGTSGFAYGFGFSPSYKSGPVTVFLNPCVRLTKINYYHDSKEDLTDISLNLGFGACYTF